MAMKVTERELQALPDAAQRVFRSLKPDEWMRSIDVLRDLHTAGHTLAMVQVDHYLKLLDERGFVTRRKSGTHQEAKRAHLVAPAAKSPPAFEPTDEPAPGPDQLLSRLDDELNRISEAAAQLMISVNESKRLALQLVDHFHCLDRVAAQAVPEAEVQALRRKAAKWDNLQAALGEGD